MKSCRRLWRCVGYGGLVVGVIWMSGPRYSVLDRLTNLLMSPTPRLDGRARRARAGFSFFYRIPPTTGNEISAEISPNFANSERKENSNSKNEISVNSDRNSVIFHRKMVSVVIFLLFQRSNEKLSNTNFVQFFEIYNFCFRNFFIWAMVWKLFNYFKNYQLKVLSFHVTTFIFSLRPQLDFYYSCYGGYSYKFLGTLVDPIESCFKSRTNMIWIGYQFMWQCLNFLFDSICIENC